MYVRTYRFLSPFCVPTYVQLHGAYAELGFITYVRTQDVSHYVIALPTYAQLHLAYAELAFITITVYVGFRGARV